MTQSAVRLLTQEFSERNSASRTARLYAELGFALARLEGDALKGWGGRSARRLLMLARRRVGGLAKLATALGRSGFGELTGVLSASRQRRLSTHIGDRTAAAIDGTIALGRDGSRRANFFVLWFLNDREEAKFSHQPHGTLLSK
jgi:hypothetical protein